MIKQYQVMPFSAHAAEFMADLTSQLYGDFQPYGNLQPDVYLSRGDEAT